MRVRGPWSVEPATPMSDFPHEVFELDPRSGMNALVAEAHGIDDAYLIAAAPEMYEALKAVAHHADDECGFMVKVRAAIQKAQGL